MRVHSVVLGVAVGVLLTGCTVGPDYETAQTAIPDAFASAISTITDAVSPPLSAKLDRARAWKSNTTPVDPAQWWQSLHDPELNSLVERATQGNLDLDVALDRLQEARTEEAVVIGVSLPTVDAAGAAGKGTGSDITRGRVPSILTSADNRAGLTQVNEIAGFDADWELDLFGKFRREIEAARYDTEAAAAARDEVLVTVIGDTVRAYVDLRGLQTRLAILRQNIEAETHALDVVRTRFNRGLTNELDVTLSERELADLKATVAPLAARIGAAQYTIAVLLGAMPQMLAKELSQPALIPALPDKIAPGLPLDLLRRRPDIRESERQIAAATARIGVATADLFPHVVISGAAGAQGQGLGVSPNIASFIWSAGPSVYWNILDFGTLDALVDIADLRAKEQLASYKQTVLNAVQDVDNDIGDFAAQQDRLRNLGDALTAAQKSVTLAQERYDRGLTDFLNVLDAERQEYGLEGQYAAAQQTAADDFAALYKALGGGWEKYQTIPPIRQPEPAIVAAFQHAFLSP